MTKRKPHLWRPSNSRRVVIVGSKRIPFAKSGTFYRNNDNCSMLTAVLKSLKSTYNLSHLDEIIAGAVINHPDDRDLPRRALLKAGFAPSTAGIFLQQACGTSLQAALVLTAKISSGQIDAGIAAGTDSLSNVPMMFNKRFTKRLMDSRFAKNPKQYAAAFSKFSLSELFPVAPSTTEYFTNLSMGQHCERMNKTWHIGREDQDLIALNSHNNFNSALKSGIMNDLITPFNGLLIDNNFRPDANLEALSKLKPVFDKQNGTITAGNATPLTDGAAGVLIASEQWAKERELPILATIVDGCTAANNFINDEGLLLAPTIAVANIFQKHKLAFKDLEHFEIHEAFAGQFLCTIRAWQNQSYCKNNLGLEHPLGSIPLEQINTLGSSLAVGHPFASTGARILGVMAKRLENEPGKGLVTACTAGGMGVAMILEN